jgi:2-keto-4-pentenoate hydratase/2-oxohepta-3-ene-1,7-dioic acid hydratase in catechol pathway
VCRLNGTVMQDSTTADMIFDVATLISECSRGTTLLPGTLILTGTPQGVGFARKPPVFLKDGDDVEIEVSGVGVVRNRVKLERAAAKL